MAESTRPQDLPDRWATLALTALATVAAELAIAEPGSSPASSLAWASGSFTATLLIADVLGRIVARRAVAPEAHPRFAPIAALLAAFALPFVVAGARISLEGRSEPMEVVLLAALRNLGLGLVAMPRPAACDRPAAVVSLFLILVSSCLAEGAIASGLLIAYAIVGAAWLAAANWRGLRLPPGRVAPGRPPAAAMALAVGLVLTLSCLAAVGPARASTALAGLVPSSGGTSWEDPDARGGVGDGENEVKGSEKPESIGFTEADVYLESDRPSLYDAFNDTYGETVKFRKMDRMISVANKEVREQEQRAAENLRAGRQFAAVRHRRAYAHGRPGDREARALVYVKGPVPLHLGLATYDRFDGRDWSEESACELAFPFSVQEGGEGPWFLRNRPTPPYLAGAVRHQIKIGSLDSSPMPLPGHVARFRMGRVDRTEFFDWAQQGIVRMADRTVPAGTVIEAVSLTCDPRRLRFITFPGGGKAANPDPYRPGDYRPDPAVRRLARAWAGAIPRGWAQIEAVVEKLRLHAAHDRGELVPPECEDAVAHFLLRSRRGPDYLFASSAVALLRDLGYTTRLVTGLYANPARFDPRTRHVPVTPEDVHAWAEVRLPEGDWVAIEPTPGYDLLPLNLGWTERLAGALAAAGRWARDRANGLMLGLLVSVALAWKRRDLSDAAATLAWHAATALDPSRGAARTLRLVDGRSRRAGLPRPPGRTPRRWYGPLDSSETDDGGDLVELIATIETHLYAPRAGGGSAPTSPDQLAACRRVVSDWTLRRFRAIARATATKEAFA